jgi:hypothetical protein
MKRALRLCALVMVVAALASSCRTNGVGDAAPALISRSTTSLLDSFVMLGAWNVDPLGTSGTVSIAQDRMSLGFKINEPAPRDKCVASIPVRMSLAGRASVLVDAEVRSKGAARLAFAVETRGNNYFESKPVDLSPGLNKDVTFSLKDSSFKCAAADWAHTSVPEGLGATVKLYLLVYGKGQGTVIFRDLRVTTALDDVGGKLLPCVSGGRWGYADRLGRIVIPQKFMQAKQFSEGLAAIMIDDKYGYVRADGTLAIAPRFDRALAMRQGVAGVGIDGKWGYVDQSGKYAVTPQYTEGHSFSCDRARVKMGSRYGYIGKSGGVAIAAAFDTAFDFSEDLACVMIGDRYGFIGKDGRTVIGAKYEKAGSFSEGRAPVRLDGKWGYIDKAGNVGIAPAYDMAGAFSHGLAPVAVGNRWGFINGKGMMLIAPQFDTAAPFSDGLAAVLLNGKWGYISTGGAIMITPVFDMAMPFADGAALVQVIDAAGDATVGHVDSVGNYIVTLAK